MTNTFIKVGENIEWYKEDDYFLQCHGKKEPGKPFVRDKQYTLAFVKGTDVDLTDVHPMFEKINDWGFVGIFPEIWIEDEGELWVEPFSVVREWWGVSNDVIFSKTKSVRIKDSNDDDERHKVIQETIDALGVLVEPDVYDEVAPHETHELSKEEWEAFKVKDEPLAWGESYTQFESGFYFDDENHIGNILVSQKMVDKYKLDSEILESLNEEWFEENDWDEEVRKDYKNYSHVIFISHRDGYSRTEDDDEAYLNYNTPHGELKSEQFVAWDIGFPVELLSEPEEEVQIMGWCDG